MPLAVKQDEALDPNHVGLFGLVGVALAPHVFTDAIKEFGGPGGDCGPDVIHRYGPTNTAYVQYLLEYSGQDRFLSVILGSVFFNGM